ncbi:MAG: hypothetical protein K9I82_03585 [Chitinophagaceae bacterium]|nr:hypothetical protein [Chitinophagaceae bacterium]
MPLFKIKNKVSLNENTLFNFLLFSFLIVYGYFYFFAVTDLSKNAYWLFMDERISYDGILKIYRPTSFQSFLDSIFFGGDLRYGRLFWNLNALISYIPYLIFGEHGQIIATRISQMIFLFLAYYFLIKTFIENRYEFNQLSYINPDIIILNANSNMYSEFNKFNFIISNNQFELIDINSKIYKVFKKVN